ncbi:restriction endonuclease subunit S [Pseudomonas alliivorans]|uniref:restriction endonuclease subunit S n=1 Tax=Pseudomonas alliivorans TaxID=2810613 RepID=UPI0020909806|nr:restriction endonuclease subunit S [Pseudomonas alliivorans]MCO5367453.1 restriction endonuclease subunit S [Pseudomonas alliivorans]
MFELDKAPLLNGKIEVLSGFAFPSSGFNQLNGLPLIRIRDLGGSTTEVRFRGAYDPAYRVSKGDLLVAMDGDFEVHRWEGEDALLNQRVCRISSASREIDQGFLYWYLKPKIAEIHRRTPQTTVRHLSTKEVYAIAEPPIGYPAQKRIAQILDTLDTAIRETQELIVKLKAVKQGLLHDLLTRGIDANGQLRPPQSEAPQLYKESPLGWIPSEWQVLRLDTVAARGSGHTPSKDVLSYWNGGVKWVSLADSHRLDQIYIHETDKEISELGIANSSAVLHPEGTVILSRDAGIGKSAILGCNMAVSQHFMAWRCGEKLNNLFLYFYLQREKPKFEAIAMGSTIKTIGLPFFKSYDVALPPRREQDQAAAILMETEQHLAAHDAELEKLRQQNIGLMDDLLTGRVRVTPLLESMQKAAAPTEF